jgi:hypothetical protein
VTAVTQFKQKQKGTRLPNTQATTKHKQGNRPATKQQQQQQQQQHKT